MKPFLRYMRERSEEIDRNRAYRFYVTDILRGVFAPESERYADIWKPQETRTADQIIGGIRAKLEG